MIPFSYSGIEVRTKTVGGEPMFVMADVCAVLEIKQPTRAASRLDDDEKGVISIHTLGGEQELLAVNESGLFALILGSRKAEAKAFKRWVTHEVLPEIRKTGSYSVAPSDPFLAMLDGVKTLYVQQQELAQRQNYVENRIDRLEQEREDARERVMALPAPEQEPRDLTTRERCRQAVDELVRLTGVGHQETWRKVYRAYDYQAGVNLTVRSQKKKIGKIEWIEKYGDVELLYGIIQQMASKAA